MCSSFFTSFYFLFPMKQAFQPHFQSIYSICKIAKRYILYIFYLFIFPLPPSRKFNVQCITESSIFACVATLCVLLIIYSSPSSVAVINPSGLLNSSLANVRLVLIISKIFVISFQFFYISFYVIPVITSNSFPFFVPFIFITKTYFYLCIATI